MAQVINLQAGERTSIVCCSTKLEDKVSISDSFTFDTPTGCVSDGKVTDPDTYAEALKKKLDIHGLKGTAELNISLASGKVMTSGVLLPELDDEQLASRIRQRASDYFQSDMTQYVLSYCVLDDEPDDRDLQKVIVYAVPEDIFDSYDALAEKSGLHINAIDISQNSLYQALKTVKINGTVLYLDVNSDHMDAVCFSDSSYVMQRSFTYVNSDQDVSADQVISDALEILNELQKSGVQVDGIMLLGQKAHQDLLRENIQKQSGKEAAFIENVMETAPLVEGKAYNASFISCASCIVKPVHLLKDERRTEKTEETGQPEEKWHLSKVALIIAAAMLLMAAVLCMVSVSGYHRKKQELTSVKNEISRLKPAKKTYKAYVTYRKESKQLDIIKKDASGNEEKLLKFFDEIQKKMPADLLTLNAQCSASSVVLDCQCRNQDSVANVISAFRQFDSLNGSDVSVTSISAGVSDSGEQVENFTITATLASDASDDGTD